MNFLSVKIFHCCCLGFAPYAITFLGVGMFSGQPCFGWMVYLRESLQAGILFVTV